MAIRTGAGPDYWTDPGGWLAALVARAGGAAGSALGSFAGSGGRDPSAVETAGSATNGQTQGPGGRDLGAREGAPTRSYSAPPAQGGPHPPEALARLHAAVHAAVVSLDTGLAASPQIAAMIESQMMPLLDQQLRATVGINLDDAAGVQALLDSPLGMDRIAAAARTVYSGLMRDPTFAAQYQSQVAPNGLTKDQFARLNTVYDNLASAAKSGKLSLEGAMAEVEKSGFPAGSTGYENALAHFRNVVGSSSGGGGAIGLTGLRDAQARLYAAQADEIGQRLAGGGATPFEIQQFKQKVDEFNRQNELERGAAERDKARLTELQRQNRMGNFLDAQRILEALGARNQLLPASRLGTAFAGFEPGGAMAEISQQQGIPYSPVTVQGQPLSAAFQALARGPEATPSG